LVVFSSTLLFWKWLPFFIVYCC